MGNVAKVVLGLVAFAGAFVAMQVCTSLARPQTPKEIQAQIEKEVAEIKPTLPKKVHPVVTWFDIEAGKQTIIYKYKIDAPREVILNKRADMEAELKKGLTGWAAQMMMPRGVKMRCELYDMQQNYLYAIDLD